AAGFSDYRINAFLRTASAFQTESRAHSGLSLPCNSRVSQRFHSMINAPGLLLRRVHRVVLRPFGLSAPPPTTGSPRSWWASSLRARCVSSFRRRQLASAASTPHPGFYARPDQSVQQFPPPFDSPSDHARFPFAPRRSLLFQVGAADQRSRVATFPEACC